MAIKRCNTILVLKERLCKGKTDDSPPQREPHIRGMLRGDAQVTGHLWSQKLSLLCCSNILFPPTKGERAETFTYFDILTRFLIPAPIDVFFLILKFTV